MRRLKRHNGPPDEGDPFEGLFFVSGQGSDDDDCDRSVNRYDTHKSRRI